MKNSFANRQNIDGLNNVFCVKDGKESKMSVFTQFDTSFGDGFFSGAEHHDFFGGTDHDGGTVGPELAHEHGGGLYHGIPSTDGGVDIFHNGHIVDHQHDMHSPGMDHDGTHHVQLSDGTLETYHHGQLVGRSVPNVHGGMDHYDAHMGLKGSTMPNGIGGEVLYDGNHHMEGITMPNIFGADDFLSFAGNADTIIGYNDPLAHAAEYHPMAFGWEK